MARVIGICNAKGGVGKTTTAVNVGAYLAYHGKRTLLVDFDPQGNASSALGAKPMEIKESVYHGILGQAQPNSLVHASDIFNFHFVPSAPHLAGAMVELVGVEKREYRLRRFITHLRHFYDYILIDLPPSLSLLTVNGLVASDEVIIPVQAQYYSMEGLGQLIETINLIKNNLGHDLRVCGALITMYDENENLSQEVASEIRKHFPHHVFKIQIPRNVPLAEAPSFGKPILLYRPDAQGAQAYGKLAEEIIAQEAKPEMGISSNQFGNLNVI